MSQNWARTVLDVSVPYSEDLVRVRQVLKEVAHDLWEDDDFNGVIIEEPEVWGVERLDVDSVVVRVTLKTAPLEQWAVAREMRQRIKARFDFEGIEIPLPQRVVWHREAAGVPRPEGTLRPDGTVQDGTQHDGTQQDGTRSPADGQDARAPQPRRDRGAGAKRSGE